MKEYFTMSLDQAEDALSFIDSTDREVWVSMGGAIKSEFGEAGFGAWDRWSQNASNYKAKSALSVWKSIKPFGSSKTATIGSLIYKAKEYGFKMEADQLTDEEKKQREQQIKAQQKKREKEYKIEQKKVIQQQKLVSKVSLLIWNDILELGGASEYLDKKKIKPFNIKFLPCALIVITHEDRHEILQGAQPVNEFFNSDRRNEVSFLYFKKGSVVVPLQNENGVLFNLQFIQSGGGKTFLKNGRKKGCFHLLGDWSDPKTALEVEGYATGASLHQATQLPVAVAFDSGNLLPVIKALKSKHPDCAFAVCGDDDVNNEKNPGRKKAEAAAKAVGGVAIFPNFEPLGVS